uniref:RING-type domain-containing protein n=1 Tax=Eptatretus burgeri TaxID=7764 RepID=A0A8C4QKM3_EPTBU
MAVFRSFWSMHILNLPVIGLTTVTMLLTHGIGVVTGVRMLRCCSLLNSSLNFEKRSSIRALLMALYLMGNVLFLYYCFHSQNLHLSLLFLPPSLEPLHLWDLLWVVGITDFIIKFGTVFLKTLLLALPQALLLCRVQGSCYEVVEEGSLLYRVLAPVRLWVTFLVHSSLDGFLLGFALSILYLLLKVCESQKLPRQEVGFMPMGLPASKQQCAQAGQLCPICQGNFCRPALLLCQHVFCEECIGLWLDRERCCPLCRLIVWEGGRRGRDGGTSTHLQLY